MTPGCQQPREACLQKPPFLDLLWDAGVRSRGGSPGLGAQRGGSQTSQEPHPLAWTWQRRREDMGPRGLQALLSVHPDTRLIGGQSCPLFKHAWGLSGARGGEAARTQTCMTFPGGCPRPSVQTSPATSWTCSAGAGCGHGACGSPALGEPGTPGWGGGGLNLRIPPLQASSGARTGPSSGRWGGRQPWSCRGGCQQGQMDAMDGGQK